MAALEVSFLAWRWVTHFMEQPLKVMVIDDSRTIRRTAQMLLG